MWYFYNYFKADGFDKLSNEIYMAFNNIFMGKEKNEIFTNEFKKKISKSNLPELFYDYYELYITLNESERRKVYKAYKRNVCIERICSGNIIPIPYDKLNENISKSLRKIFDYLYKEFTKIKVFKDEIGGLKKYYEDFFIKSNINKKLNCPFCGIQPLATSDDKHRPPFDHYLLESKYPFVSLLRKNLVPMCHDCNSNYKGVTDISDKKKVFFPFSDGIENKLVYTNKKYKIISLENDKEIESWNEIFDVENRINNYAKLRENGWLTSVVETQIYTQISLEESFELEILKKKNNNDFIAKSYLESINRYKDLNTVKN